jgi:hypothetical protein
MNELSEIKNLLETHRRESNEWREVVTKTLTKIETHNEYTQKKLDIVDKLEKESQRQKGFLYALTLIGLGGIEEFFRHLAK